MFEGVDELEVGMQFHASGPDGAMQIVTVRDIDGDQVTVDGIHPLAASRLNFDVKVVNVRAASDEEMPTAHPWRRWSSPLSLASGSRDASCPALPARALSFVASVRDVALTPTLSRGRGGW